MRRSAGGLADCYQGYRSVAEPNSILEAHELTGNLARAPSAGSPSFRGPRRSFWREIACAIALNLQVLWCNWTLVKQLSRLTSGSFVQTKLIRSQIWLHVPQWCGACCSAQVVRLRNKCKSRDPGSSSSAGLHPLLPALTICPTTVEGRFGELGHTYATQWLIIFE